VLRLYGLKRDELTGDWKKLHKEELHNLNSSPSIMRWAGHEEEKRNAYSILVGKPQRKKPPGGSRHGWENIIKIDFRQVGCGDIDGIHQAQLGTRGGLVFSSKILGNS
jgi:hypothetical protein